MYFQKEEHMKKKISELGQGLVEYTIFTLLMAIIILLLQGHSLAEILAILGLSWAELLAIFGL